MKPWAYTTVSTLILSAGVAYAGMRHPVEQDTTAAVEVERTQVHFSVPSSARVMPDRMQPAAPPSAKGQPAPAQLPAQVKGLPQAPKAAPQAQQASQLPRGPVPKAPGLPDADRFNVPPVHIPNAPGGDGLISLKPEPMNLRGTNRAQIHSFLRKAREIKMTSKEYTKEVQSREIVARYKEALNPTPYKSFRTPYKLSIAGITKILNPPPVAHYENMVKRMDSLFLGLELSYPRAVLGLWELSETPSNAKNLQARDALFAGVLSQRAGWEAPAANLFAAAAAKRVDAEDRYVGILWEQLEAFSHTVHVDQVISKVNPARASALPLLGDKANYAMAKRMLLEKHRAPLAVNPPADQFLGQIASRATADRFRLLSYVGQIRAGKESDRAKAIEAIRAIEAEGEESNRQEARLALARVALQGGKGQEALAMYRAITKNGKNRLEVMAEQTYAEYMSGEYQESLGKAVALQSPYFVYGFSPDIHLVEILSRKALCDFGGAEATVRRFGEVYGAELASIEATLSSSAQNPAAYYETLVGYGDLEKPMRFQRYLVQLPAVMENQKAMNHALTDLEKLDRLGRNQQRIVNQRPEGFDRFATAMRSHWAARAQQLRLDSAGAALREAGYLSKRLRNTFAQVELLDLDVSTGASKNYNLQSALNFPARKAPTVEADQDKFRWPFETEIWEDEIDFMKAKNPSKCAVQASL